jgi:hypothetical protein
MSEFFVFVVSGLGKGLAMGLAPAQAVLPNIWKFTISEANSEFEQPRQPNP